MRILLQENIKTEKWEIVNGKEQRRMKTKFRDVADIVTEIIQKCYFGKRIVVRIL